MIAEEWIEQGAQALYELHPEGYQKPVGQRHAGDAEHVQAAAVLAGVVPLILADRTEIVNKILALPEDGANKSRDAGRGYSQAVTDVLAILRGQTP